MKIKAVLRSLLSGVCADRNMSFASCISCIPDEYRDRSGHGWDYRDLCDLLHGWWISGGKDHQEREIPLGRPGRSLLFHTFGNCFFYCERKLGYEPGTYDNNAFVCALEEVLLEACYLKKKMLLIEQDLCYTMPR